MKNCGDDSSMFLLCGGHLGDTIVDGNTDLSGNIILKSGYLVLSYLYFGLHNGYAKYSIWPSKTETVTNITLHKITERIESCKILEFTDDEGSIHWLIGLKCTVIVADTGSPIPNNPHSVSLVFCETKVPIQVRVNHTPRSLKRQGSFRYLHLFYTEILVVLIPIQNMFKMFPHISVLENIAFVKGQYWDLSIAIEAILFNLDRWWWSLIHHTNTLANLGHR